MAISRFAPMMIPSLQYMLHT